jgi:hypothetical protein
MKTIDERKIILEKEISKHISNGWIIQSRSETTCQFTKDKKVNGCLALVLLLIFILPGIIYLCLSSDTKSLYVNIDEGGQVNYLTTGLNSFEKAEMKWN